MHLVLHVHINGVQYSINDPEIQSSCGSVPVNWFENKDRPESATKTVNLISHLIQGRKKLDKEWHKWHHTSTYTNHLEVQRKMELFQSGYSSLH